MKRASFALALSLPFLLLACGNYSISGKNRGERLRLPERAPADNCEAVALDGGPVDVCPTETQVVRPEYPRNAREIGTEGTVVLELFLSATGEVEAVEVLEGEVSLAKAAVAAARQWKFKPAYRNGKPIPAKISVPLDFYLRGR